MGGHWVYPRVCGGTLAVALPPHDDPGLSPRVRGNRHGAQHTHRFAGSIPACAGEPCCRRTNCSRSRVYPRVCGGTEGEPIEAEAMVGLSPRVRGNPVEAHRPFHFRGSIPACAGEPEPRRASAFPQRVYPRVCGGTQGDTLRLPAPAGLSPRVRGNRADPPAHRRPGGSIPACAGEPRRRPPPTLRERVYPRVCGGTNPQTVHKNNFSGLSPRVRGNPEGEGGRRLRQGSIPACAGEPLNAARGGEHDRVYPRVCGGTGVAQGVAWARTGLSPRVRGNPPRCQAPFHPLGSIPACAGEPANRASPPCRTGVYPRVCGGTERWEPWGYLATGLSPRVRGNLAVACSCSIDDGSIPACAGEPLDHRCRVGDAGVYPRVCGGTRSADEAGEAIRGLSPRVRGNLIAALGGASAARSIPACAGEPGAPEGACEASGVYPRVCGGTSPRLMILAQAPGLSPRVRGNLSDSLARKSSIGSIPACAGEPRPTTPTRCKGRVYPRVCGGTRDTRQHPLNAAGLSPRVRGNHLQDVARSAAEGSIPACAGEPRSAGPPRTPGRVYPRVCGGTYRPS